MKRLLALCLALLLPALSPGLRAQSGAGVEGTVLDPDTKAVVNAAVVIRNEGSGAITTASTDGRGHFTASVAPGSYAVEVFVPGFEAVRRAGVRVEGGMATVAIQLSVAN